MKTASVDFTSNQVVSWRKCAFLAELGARVKIQQPPDSLKQIGTIDGKN